MRLTEAFTRWLETAPYRAADSDAVFPDERDELIWAVEAELPALLAVVEAARQVHREYSATWDGPALRTLGAALAALEQESGEGR